MTHHQQAELFFDDWESENKDWPLYPEIMIEFAAYCLEHQEKSDLQTFFIWIGDNTKKLIGLSIEEKVQLYLYLMRDEKPNSN